MMARTYSRLAIVLVGSVWMSAAAPGPPGVDERRAEPVAVGQPEGMVRGYLALTTLEGDTLAWGELIQTAGEGVVHSRTLFDFTDGSVHDERATFTQDGVFSLQRYTLLQEGPSFPTQVKGELDTTTGAYRVEARELDDQEAEVEVHEDTLDLPRDVYSGMMPIIAKNLAAAPTTVHLVVFDPDARLVEVTLSPADETFLEIGHHSRPVRHWVLDPDLGFPDELLATAVGRDPPDNHIWIATGDAPAFVRFEGTLYPEGPIWRIDLAAPRLTP